MPAGAMYFCLDLLREVYNTISVTLIRVGPPGYFIHVSITTPIVSASKNYYI
jgi:hypothetical protein